MRTETKM